MKIALILYIVFDATFILYIVDFLFQKEYDERINLLKGAEMAKTVNGAFRVFMKEVVSLDTLQSEQAKKSRDWMISQIHRFDRVTNFPDLCNEIDIYYGSFARRTKIRELDDIDLMIGFKADGASWVYGSSCIEIIVPSETKTLRRLCHSGTDRLNSRLVINQITKNLKSIPQYEAADIKRNQEAATLKLKSYPWNFDIVPCFITKEDKDGDQSYLIPDGIGNWKPTDPRIDQNRISRINQKHSGIVLPTIRLLKYWQRRGTMPTMSSYLLECMILDYYELNNESTGYIDLEFSGFLEYLKDQIFYEVEDPKEMQGNINLLSDDEILKIAKRAEKDYQRAMFASRYEEDGNHLTAIDLWRKILGEHFPKYL
jgi:hypothetical protein